MFPPCFRPSGHGNTVRSNEGICSTLEKPVARLGVFREQPRRRPWHLAASQEFCDVALSADKSDRRSKRYCQAEPAAVA